VTNILRDKGLVKVFKRYQKRYLAGDKKPDVKKSFPDIVYRTMKLEGEKITKKEAKVLFQP